MVRNRLEGLVRRMLGWLLRSKLEWLVGSRLRLFNIGLRCLFQQR